MDLKPRLEEEALQELLSYSVFPDPERLNEAVQMYRNGEAHLFGIESEGSLVGLIGYRYKRRGLMEVTHLSVYPEERGKGYGRGLILELLAHEKPSVLYAETDEDALDFYRSIGFRIVSLGDAGTQIERFTCIFEAEES